MAIFDIRVSNCLDDYTMKIYRTLEDALVNSIQRTPCQPLAKLALADLLEERGASLEAIALRWCAKNRRWPQRRGYVEEYRNIPDKYYKPTGYLWQWWHPSVKDTRKWSKGFRIAGWAIITDEISRCWSSNGTWGCPTWFAALTALGLALEQLGGPSTNGQS